MMVNSVIGELENIIDYRRRFYTTIFVSSDTFSLSFKLLYVTRFSVDDGVLLVYFDNGSQYKFVITTDFKISFVEETPVLDEKERRRRNRKR